MKLKKGLAVTLVVFLVFSFVFCFYSLAQTVQEDVLVNNMRIAWQVTPLNIDGVGYVPMREISGYLHIESSFDVNKQSGSIKLGENVIEFKLDNKVASLNGKYIQLTGPIKIINNRVMIPVRTFENIGMIVTYRNASVLVYYPINQTIIYKVVSGDYLWKVSQMFNTTISNIKSLNNLNTDSIYVGQELIVKKVSPFTTNFDATTGNATIKTGAGWAYSDLGYLLSGANVKVIGKNGDWFKATTPKGTGYIYYSVVKVTQNISDTTPASVYFNGKIPVDTSKDTLSYASYTVRSGDTGWSIAEKFGIPVEELMAANGKTINDYFMPNQIIKVPVHTIAIKPVSDSKYGEVLDWFSEAQYVLPIGKKGKLIDLQTGVSFYIQRTMGASHSDTETLTAQDSATMKQIFGGSWNWSRRPFILEVDGRRLAVSVAGMPHAGVDGVPFLQNVANRSDNYGYGPNYDKISGNSMNGHFDMYFLNSLKHMDNQIDSEHQKRVCIAGGLQ